MNTKIYEFEAVIQKVPDQDGAYIVFPYDIKAEFGKGRVKVHATFDGQPYDGSIVNMGVKNPDGSVCYIIGIRKDIRDKIGKQPGDRVRGTIRKLIFQKPTAKVGLCYAILQQNQNLDEKRTFQDVC